MIYRNNEILRGYLERGASLRHRAEHYLAESFVFEEKEFTGHFAHVRKEFPKLAKEEVEARAAFRILTSRKPAPITAKEDADVRKPWRKWLDAHLGAHWQLYVVVAAIVALLLLATIAARAQGTAPSGATKKLDSYGLGRLHRHKRLAAEFLAAQAELTRKKQKQIDEFQGIDKWLLTACGEGYALDYAGEICVVLAKPFEQAKPAPNKEDDKKPEQK